MSRFTENKLTVELMDETIDKLRENCNNLSDDNIRNVNLGTIAVMLADISKSLAVIADALDKED